MSGRRGVTVWFTGLSGAGKSTISAALEVRLRERGLPVELLDGDVVRENLSKGLGFSKEDRDANIRRIGFVAELLTRHRVVVLVAAISPYRAVRDEVRARIGNFVEIHVRASLDSLIARDVKGLYRRALAGEIANFTGVSDPYEAPLAPELVIETDVGESVEASVARILAVLEAAGYLPALAEAAA
ncbi:MAG TPA: adenylyl-sulfate kinase [Candidatus Dormibacteraeota bacterium]